MKRLIVFIAAFFASSLTAAEPVFDAAETTKKLAPFIDQHTFLVGRIDLRQIDISVLVALIEPALPTDKESNEIMQKTVKAWQGELIKKGGREIYVVYGASDFPNLPCLLMPIADSPKERHDLAEILMMPFEGEKTTTASINGFQCVGTSKGIDRLKQRQPARRPDIAAALASTNDFPSQIVFAPGAETRKIFDEIAPILPTVVGGGSMHTFTRGMKWISAALGPAPRFECRLELRAADAEAAKKIEVAVSKGFASAKELFPSADAKEHNAWLKLHGLAVRLLTPTADGDRLLIKHDLGTAMPELAELLKNFQPPGRDIKSENLKQLALAAHSYYDTFAHLPTNITSKDGKPLLSWRVAILPYLEHDQLYRRFKLDEPWDSEHNKKLIALMPKVYKSPKQAAEHKDRTTYLAPLGVGLAWDNPKGTRFEDITDGTSVTILLVESNDERAVVWTKPDDIAIDMKHPAKGLLGHFNDGFLAAYCDGSVHFVPKDYSAIWALFTRAGGESLPEK